MKKTPALSIDHLVVNVRHDMSRAQTTFENLGFVLTPSGRHTMGSINHLMVFGHDYIELIGLPTDGATLRDELLASPVGIDGLVFQTDDADRTHASLASTGQRLLPVQSFSRPVDIDGNSLDAKFRTVRFEPGRFAAGRVYFCQHFTPELVWRDVWQHHPCGVTDIAALLIVSNDPQQDANEYAELAGLQARPGLNGEYRIDGPQHTIVVLSPEAYADCYGALACESVGRSSFFGAIALRVNNLEPIRDLLEHLENEMVPAPASSPVQNPSSAAQADFVFRDRGDRIAVKINGFNTLLEFVTPVVV